ncbi:MAG TPA: 1,2-phenylacetyl-CoA epoxidase subunit PaaC [Burkholderiaceae bacterium]|nr:1,2-phenylacetyl-CoA epoxidase subunit PaaC [Burkholderiaceae bacterium]
MQASIRPSGRPDVRYLLRLGDTCLILAQRLSEWCGHAPVLEEDIALANMALDLIGQARGVLSRAAALDGQGFDEDGLAFLRDEHDYLNPTIVELPNGVDGRERPGDFAFTVVRNALVSTWMKAWWERLRASRDAELAAIAGKAAKEVRYHQQHAADWVVRLGDGTTGSRDRCVAALRRLWPYTAELFEDDAVDEAARAAGLGPVASELQAPWRADVDAILREATLEAPAPSAFRSGGRAGRHSEHMGYVLAEMQVLQRAYPGGAW